MRVMAPISHASGSIATFAEAPRRARRTTVPVAATRPLPALIRVSTCHINSISLTAPSRGAAPLHPILTFSATRDDFALGAPAEAYAKMIVSGLKETYPSMCDSQILEYLSQADGIRDVIHADVLARWVLGD